MHFRRLAALKKYGSISNDKYLLSEFDKKRNIFNSKEIPLSSHQRVWWSCSKCKNSYITPVAHRFHRNQGCKKCYLENASTIYRKAFIKGKETLDQTHPSILNEWNYKKNKLKPKELTYGSGYKAFWICKKKHEWQTSISNRINLESNCPECKITQTSRIEILFYTQLKFIFGDVTWRKKIYNKEIDIYLDKYDVGIEYDGSYFHKKSYNRDLIKTKFLQNKGIEVIRIRDSKLKKISSNDFILDEQNKPSIKSSNKEIKKLINLILNKIKVSKSDNQSVQKYLKKDKLENIKFYRKIISNLPWPLPEKSLLNTHKSLCKEWHISKNHPLKPIQFSHGSGEKIWWKCKQGHSSYIQNIRDRTKKNSPQGCPKCASKKSISSRVMFNIKKFGSIKKNNLLNKEFNTKKNKIQPSEINLNSSKKYWWKCSICSYEWKTLVRLRSAKGQGCYKCNHSKGIKKMNINFLRTRGTVKENNLNLVLEWHKTKNGNKKPNQFTSGSKEKIWWKCKNNHVWKASIDSRARGTNCQKCWYNRRFYN